MSPFDGDSNTIGIQYCPGYVDKNGSWRAGFYCPPKSQGRKMYCCGSTVHKYCCGSKEENELFGGSSISYISSSTMFTVTIVTFIFAVMLTVLGFVCCRKFFKRHLGGLEGDESHSYRMANCSGDINQVDGQTVLTSPLTGLPVTNQLVPVTTPNGNSASAQGATTTTLNLFDLADTSTAMIRPYNGLITPSTVAHHLFNGSNGNRLIDSYLPTISSYINQPSIGFIEPPPPYQVTPNYYSDLNNNSNNNNNNNNNSNSDNSSVNNQSSNQQQQPMINSNSNNHNVTSFVDRTNNNQNRILSMLGAPYRRDIIHPCEGQKRLWRTMSQ